MSWLTILFLLAIFLVVCLLAHRQKVLIGKLDEDREYTGLRSRRNFSDELGLLSLTTCRIGVFLVESDAVSVSWLAQLRGRTYALGASRVGQVFEVSDAAEAHAYATSLKRQLGDGFSVAWALSEPNKRDAEPHNRRNAQRILSLAETHLVAARRSGSVYPNLQPPPKPSVTAPIQAVSPVDWERVEQVVIYDPVGK